MAYSVYPYSQHDMRAVPLPPEEVVEFPKEPKRGDLEGYIAAKDFTSQTYSACVSSKAQANIRQLNNLRSDMTSREYMNILIKQGQVPEKHFKYQRPDDGEIITELNSNRDAVKRVYFNSYKLGNETIPVVSRYYNPDTGEVFKEVYYRSDGTVDVRANIASLAVPADVEPAVVQNNATVPIKATSNPFEKLGNM